MSLAPLFELSTQFQAKNGRNNTAGFLRVFLAGTDDPAVTYSDYNGTLNTRDIYLDDDGRAVVICDSSKAYRLEVYDANGMLMWTEEPVWCTGSGGGVGSVTDIVSQDGSIVVSETTVGQVTTFDLSIAPDSSEMLEWVETENSGVSDGTVIPGFVDGTMEVVAGSGLFLQANEMYHVTNSFTVTPMGNGINYDTLNVKLMLDSTELCSRSYDVDNSLNDTVECEFSYDVSTTADGYLYWVISGASAFSNVDAKMQVHRIYSGIAAVPSTYATKAYVDSGLSGKVSYSAIEYNTASQITGISGSAIATTNVDPNEYVPWSASGAFQPSGNYVSADDFSSCCSAMSGAVSSLQVDVSAISSVVSGITGATGNYVEKSSISAESATWNEVSAKLDASASSLFQPSGDYAYNSSVSSKVEQSAFDQCCSAMSAKVSALETGKLDNSASSTWYPMTGNPSGFLTEHQELSGYVAKSSISAESANWNEVSAKQDSSAMSAYVPFSAVESNTASAITSIGGSAIKGHEYTGIAPVVVDNVNDEISVQHSSLTVDSSMTAYESAGQIVLGVNNSSVVVTSTGSGKVTIAGIDRYFISSINGSAISAASSYYANSAFYAGKANSADTARTAYKDVNGRDLSSIGLDSGDYVRKDAVEVAIGSANTANQSSMAQGVANSAQYESLAQGTANTAGGGSLAQGINNKAAGWDYGASGYSLAQGNQNTAYDTSIAQGYKNSSRVDSFAQGSQNTAYSYSFAQGVLNYASVVSFAQGDRNSASNYSFAQGNRNSADHSAVAFGTYNLLGDGASTGDNIAFVIGDGTHSTARHDLLNVFKDGRIVTYSSTADTTGYDYKSAISSKLDTSAYSSVSGTFLTAVPAGYATESYVDSAVSGKLDATASSQFITSLPADLATTADVASAVSGKLDTSATGEFYPMTGNPSGFLTAHQSLAGYATEQYVDSSVSGKLDSTAYDSAQFYLASNPSGFATTSYVDSAVSGVEITFDSSITTASSTAGVTASVNTAIFSGKLDASAEVVTSIGVAAGALSSINNYGISAGTANSASTALYDSAGRALTSMATKAEASGAAMAYAASAISSVSGNYYSTSNPSGFITGVDLSNYATTAYVDSAVSGVEISFDSSITTASSTGGVTASVNTAIFSGKLDASASSDFYLTSNPSGFITGVDLTPYQLTADMTAYIYASALGTGVI